MGVSPEAVSKLIGKGRRTNNIKLETAKKLADAAGVDLEFIFEYLFIYSPQEGVQDA